MDRLVESVAEFAGTVAEHRRDDDEILPHVLFGDLTVFVVAAHHEHDNDLVTRCLAFLDGALRAGDDYVQNLVAVSFVENVAPWDGAHAEFIQTWPAALRAEAVCQRDLAHDRTGRAEP